MITTADDLRATFGLTLVSLVWIDQRRQHWIRFGHPASDQVLDRHRRVMGFKPGSMFALVRWAAGSRGTMLSRLDILIAPQTCEPCISLPGVRPGGISLLRLTGWSRVEKALQVIDAVEALKLDPAVTAPDYWRHVHARLSVGETPTSLYRDATSGVVDGACGASVSAPRHAALAGLGALGLVAIVASAAPNRTPWLLWNTTASAQLGLYRLRPAGALRLGEWVAVRPPPVLARALDKRGALPLGVPLLKEIAALSPSLVCRDGIVVTVDGRQAAIARTVDRRGQGLPTWSGCSRLGQDQVFLLNSASNSLDSRYFGPLPTTTILGEARQLWRFGDRL